MDNKHFIINMNMLINHLLLPLGHIPNMPGLLRLQDLRFDQVRGRSGRRGLPSGLRTMCLDPSYHHKQEMLATLAGCKSRVSFRVGEIEDGSKNGMNGRARRYSQSVRHNVHEENSRRRWWQVGPSATSAYSGIVWLETPSNDLKWTINVFN